STRRVTFVNDLFEVLGLGSFPGTSLNRAFDTIVGHTLRARRKNRAPQSRICVRIATTGFRGDADFLRELAENLAAFRVDRAFETLDLRPLAMSRHTSTKYFKTAKFA